MSAWIVTPRLITQLVAGAIKLGVIEVEQAQSTGVMLTRANVKSIRARYGEYDEGAKAVRPYVWRPPTEAISNVSLLKQVAHYDYQTCEFDGYPESKAGRFVVRMEEALAKIGVTRDSPGYRDAPWGI